MRKSDLMNDSLNKEMILIVDDNPQNIVLLGELLNQTYQIKVATNGNKALDIAFSDKPPDLILLDVMMPEMDGYEVCIRLKERDSTAQIPIIFITGKHGEQDEIRGFELGAVDYIRKPFNPTVVRARVKTHLELKKYRDILENMSLVDGLTGIPNRRKLDTYFDTTWDIAVRESLTYSVIMIDIDYFKFYNDDYGHQSGDECLVTIAQKLASLVNRKTDLVARYGGEEFVCILINTHKEDACKFAEKMRTEIESLKIEHAKSKVSDYVTVSVGVATMLPLGGIDQKEILTNADKALYESKEQGRNRVTHFDTIEMK